jgi:hypothetical protein
MPRPIRIEYDNAYDHVLNRGRRQQCIFPTEAYDHVFLATLAEAHERFGFVIHGHCLLGNHDHLLLHTPCGNLGRAMRHINGIYTKRYNRLQKVSGTFLVSGSNPAERGTIDC